MTPTRRTAVALALLGSLSLTAGALAATPKKGSKFKGTASGTIKFATSFTAKDPLSFTVSGNSKKLTSVAYTDSVCGLAASKLVKLGSIQVNAAGKFSASKVKSAALPDSLEDGGTVVTTTTISGKFTSAKKATGTLEYAQKQSGSATASCGPIKLKFTLSAS
jgi:hypothetical protein